MAAALAIAARGSDGIPSNAGTAAPDTGTPTTPAKNVVFFLGDGMGMITITAAHICKVNEDGELAMDTLPGTGFVWTFSSNAQVTGSVPSISAYMTGVKMNNEVISMSLDTMAYDTDGKDCLSDAGSIYSSDNGKSVAILLELMKAVGYGTSMVITTHITHATLAATYPHICHRDDENTAAIQLTPAGRGFNAALDDGVDTVFGSGHRHLRSTTVSGARIDGHGLVTELKAGNYRYVNNKAGFNTLQATDGKVIGLFTSNHTSYNLGHDSSKEPGLGEMTSKAIGMLTAKKKGFFLMVGGGRIDHALHEITARKVLRDAVAFDSAVRDTIGRLSTVDPSLKNTLVVVTADHDHTLVFNNYAKHTNSTSDSNPGILGLFKSYVTGTNATSTGGNPFTAIGFGAGGNRPATRNALTDVAMYDKNYYQEAMIPAAPGDETHDDTDVFIDVCDLDVERFTGTMNNAEVFGLTKQAMGP